MNLKAAEIAWRLAMEHNRRTTAMSLSLEMSMFRAIAFSGRVHLCQAIRPCPMPRR
jgi:hypothetical protein